MEKQIKDLYQKFRKENVEMIDRWLYFAYEEIPSKVELSMKDRCLSILAVLLGSQGQEEFERIVKYASGSILLNRGPCFFGSKCSSATRSANHKSSRSFRERKRFASSLFWRRFEGNMEKWRRARKCKLLAGGQLFWGLLYAQRIE